MRKLFGIILLLATMAMPTYAKPALKALTPGATILFQGDSITEGGRWQGDDQNHIMGQDYAYIVAAQIGLDYPDRQLHFVNRGVSGNTVVDLANRWQADAIALKPDVLSIMVGVNDTFYSNGQSIETYEQTYDTLIAETLKALPNVKIILGESFLLPSGGYKADYDAKRAALAPRQAVARKLAAKYDLPLIEYQRAFDEAMKLAPAEHWAWDGVHPTYAGHGLMAREWSKAVNKAWK
jgi:lysophospholipase L1-like esterase